MRIHTKGLALLLSVVVIASSVHARAEEPTEASDTTEVAPSDEPDFVEALQYIWNGVEFPENSFWAPRRGARTEISALIGGEAAFEAVQSDRLPSIGGVSLNAVGRYYPVDRMAVVLGMRAYLGLDGVPAAGTTASSVATLLTGIRYDLVRQGRFSLMWDVYSGPSLYIFANITDVTQRAYAIGGELGTGVAMRLSLAQFTGEVRLLGGARAGASSTPFQRAFGAGPFSAVYAALELGGAWTMDVPFAPDAKPFAAFVDDSSVAK